MTRHFSWSVLASAFLVLFSAASIVRAQAPNSYVPGEVIVKFRPSVDETDARAVRSSLNATVKERFESIGAELWEISGVAVPDAVTLLGGDSRITYVEPNYIVHADDLFPNDPRFGELWGLHNTGQSGGMPDADIDAPEAWSLGTGGDVLVGVIDTGVDWDHVDLAGNIYTNPGEIPGNGIDDDGNGYVDDVHGWDFVNHDNNPDDDHGHGTHVSGTIAGMGNNGIGVVGVSWSAKIMPLKFLSADGSGSTADAILAVEYATMMGARLTSNSWGGGAFSAALRSAIEEAGNQGILFIAAAGNDGSDNDVFPHYPSSYDLDNIISVASTDRNDLRSGFSNYGLVSVDLGAPGTDILSTFPNNTYGTISGTSMATPHVSGAVCLVWAAAPGLTRQEVRNAILSSVDPLPALAGRVGTGGRLNIHNLLSGLDDVPPGRVGDLSVQSTGSTSALLTWTATGDDGPDGTAHSYDLRYSTTGIYWNNFASATPAAGTPQPGPAGTPESFEVTGLDVHTKYFFALVVEDEQGNRSPLSNLPSGTTLGAPHLTYSPGSFSADLHTGGTGAQVLTLGNDAEGTLDFSTMWAPSWVSLNPPAGRIHAGQSIEVGVVFDATGLVGGAYDSTITIATNNPAQPEVALAVALQVTDAPDIAVVPAALDFGNLYTGQCRPDTLIITNIGTIPLDVAGITANNGEFSVDPAAFTLAPAGSRVLVVNFCPVTVGSIVGTLAVQSNDPDTPAFSVSLQGVGVSPPVIDVTPPSLSADLFTGGVSAQTLSIANNGGSDLDFQISLEDLDGTASSIEVFGSQTAASNVVGTGRPLSPAELTRLSASFPKQVAVGSSGEIDRGSPSSKSASPAMALGRVRGTRLEEVFGSDQNRFVSGPRTRGNLFTCTESTNLVEHRLYMATVDPTELWFLVYEGATQVGTYTLISASDVSPAAPGSGWFSSGEVNVPLEAGRFYLIVASFQQVSSYYNEQFIAPYPIPASFGELTAGAGWDWAPTSNFPPDPAQDVPDYAFGSPVAYYQTLVTGGVVRWLSLEPEVGTVPPAASLDVAVTFDAAGLIGGDYNANVRIAGNDPVTPEVVVPAHLHVTGAPDITLSEALLDYGVQFVGATVKDTLVVSNAGTDVLTVSSIASSHAAYTADVSSFMLAPGEHRDVVVTFAPIAPGSFPAMLTIVSDDPDESVLALELRGEGVNPPIIAVSPPSLSADLLTGGTETRTLNISNSGESDLTFGIGIDYVSAPGAAAGPLSGSGTDSARDVTPLSAARRDARGRSYVDNQAGPRTGGVEVSAATNLSLSALKVLLLTTGDVTELQSLLLSFPDITVVDTFNGGSATPTPGTLSNYDAVILVNAYRFASPDSVGDVLADYVDQGGGVIMTLASFISNWEIGGRFLSGGYYPFTLGSGPVGSATLGNFDQFHPIMAGVATAWGDFLGSTSVAPGAAWVADWDNGQPFVATQGDHVVGVNAFVADGGYWTGDVALVLHNAAGWAAGAAWLRVEPADGVVAPNGNSDVQVTFDASGLFGGEYVANLRVLNNDPLDPEVVVPATMDVTGAPDIALSTTHLDYGAQFIGAVVRDTLVVKNEGTDLLTVSNIASNHADYTTDVSSFTLAPALSRFVIVAFAPTSSGPLDGTLTILSDDFDEGVLQVTLQGTGVEPPVITVVPASLSEDLVTGETAMQTMTISNSGASPLEFQIGREKRDVPGGTAKPNRGEWVSLQPGDANAVSAGDPSDAVHAHLPVVPVEGPANADPGILVIQDYLAWGVDMHDFIQTQFGINATVINSSHIASTDFSLYDVIITTGDQTSYYYNALTSNVAKFQAFVQAGGVIQYQLATQGSNVSIAGGAQVLFGNTESYNDVVAPTHPLVAGLSPVLQGNWANHTYITNLPAGAVVITETSVSGVPTTAEFEVGSGTVVVTGMTWEWLYQNGWEAGQMLGRAVEYSLSLAGVPWLGAGPASGTVLPGESMDVTVSFDAVGLFGGDYAANLLVINNDPLHPEVTVPVDLHVTGAPDISVSPASLSFGPVYVGQSASQDLEVSNVGTDVLTITGIVSSHPDYSVDVTSFVLGPTETRVVAVTFAPTSAASFPATLTIASDDPDEPALDILLQGDGIEPPVISVTPVSLSEDLLTGGSASQIVTISNQGQSPLLFTIDREKRDPVVAVAEVKAAWQSNATVAGGSSAVRSTDASPGDAVSPLAAPAVAGPAILVIQDYAAWGVYMANVIVANFGLTPTVINSAQILTRDFSPFDLIIVVGGQSNAYYTAVSQSVAKFEAFVMAGGVVQYQAASFGGATTMPAGARVVYGNVETYNEVVAPGHPIVAGLPPVLYGSAANHGYLTQLPQGAVVITRTQISQQPTTAEFKVGRGTVIATGMTWEFLYGGGYVAGAMLTSALEYSLSLAGVGWLSAAPEAGVVQPGAAVDVTVGFDAEGLIGGDYAANLRIASNDPVTPEWVVPVDLHVTGAPDIVVSPTSLFFGTLFIGESTSQTVTVRNIGTDMLTVSAVSSSHADFSPGVTSFVLAPAGSQTVDVVFSPGSEGSITGTLTITSDDPDEQTSSVLLEGAGVRGVPDITVTPEVFVNFGTVTVGATVQQNVVVQNDGTGLLTVSDISTDHPDFSASPTQLTLARAASETIVVSFAPTTVGPLFAHLNITSDDPDEGLVSLFLLATVAEPPAISVDPSSVADTLAAGGSDTRTVRISNGGLGELSFSVDAVEIPVGAAESGGPDPAGYRWRDSNDPGGPAYAWIDATAGSNIGLTDNSFATGIPLGFMFRYYDTEYTTIGVGSNGWLSFNGAGNLFPDRVPFDDAFAGAIAPFARDLNPGLGAFVRYMTTGDAPNRQFVIEYHSIPIVGGGGVTFEVILTEGVNSIKFQYLSTTHSPLGLGIESPDQTLGIGNNGLNDLHIAPALVTSEYAIEFSPAPLWLGIAPVAGTVPPGGTLDLVVTMDATELSAGEYAGRISIRSNDPVNPLVTVPVSLVVNNVLTTGINPLATPTTYALLPNHPNPFNPTTTIAYDLPQGVKVQLVIYDVSGKAVKELVGGNQPAGHHEIVWDGRNASGEGVASGVYFYRLIAGSFVQTRKMVLLK